MLRRGMMRKRKITEPHSQNTEDSDTTQLQVSPSTKTETVEILKSGTKPPDRKLTVSSFDPELQRLLLQLLGTWHPAKSKTELIRTGPVSHTHTHTNLSVFSH